MLSVVIATRNRARSLQTTLDSLRSMSAPDSGWEIVVVDNGSTDGTAEVVRRVAAESPVRVRCLVEPREGKSIAVNTGVQHAQGEFLAFTDDDVEVDRGWGRALIAAMQRPGYIGAGGRIIAEWSRTPPAWLAPVGSDRLMNVVAFDLGREAGELSAPPFGPNMAFRREAFERYGPFRTDLGPGRGRYLPGQDTEFGRRLIAAGERLAWAPDAVVRHTLQTEKMTKRYVTSWYFGYGRMWARISPPPATVVTWAGVPRHLLRRLASNAARWAICTDVRRSFRYRAEAARTAGEIMEAFLRRQQA